MCKRMRDEGREASPAGSADLDVLLNSLTLAVVMAQAQGGWLSPDYLREQHPELLRHEVLEHLQWMAAKAIVEGNTEATTGYCLTWSLLSQMHHGNEEHPLPPQLDESMRHLHSRMREFLRATSWSDGKRAVADCPELLGDAAERLLVGLVSAYRACGTEAQTTSLQQRLSLLQRVREVGIDAAFGQPDADNESEV